MSEQREPAALPLTEDAIRAAAVRAGIVVPAGAMPGVVRAMALLDRHAAMLHAGRAR